MGISPHRAAVVILMVAGLACGRVGFTPGAMGVVDAAASDATNGRVAAPADGAQAGDGAGNGDRAEVVFDAVVDRAVVDRAAQPSDAAPGTTEDGMTPAVDAPSLLPLDSSLAIDFARDARAFDVSSPEPDAPSGAASAPDGPEDVALADVAPGDVEPSAVPVQDTGLAEAEPAASVDAETADAADMDAADMDSPGAVLMDADGPADAPADGPLQGEPPGDVGGDAPADAAPDAALACGAGPDAGVIFCEDFENLTLPLPGGSPYSLLQSNASEVAISMATVGRGLSSLRALVHPSPPAKEGWAGLRRNYTPVVDGVLVARSLMWVAPGAPPQDWVVLLELQGATNANGDQKTSVDVFNNDQIALTSTAAQAFVQAPAMSLPRSRWFCLEMLIKVSPAGSDGYIELFLDGASLVKSATGINTTPPGGWTGATIGINHVSGLDQDLEVFVDDFVLARSRLGCP